MTSLAADSLEPLYPDLSMDAWMRRGLCPFAGLPKLSEAEIRASVRPGLQPPPKIVDQELCEGLDQLHPEA